MSCKVRSAKNKTRSQMINNSVIDHKNNILNKAKFNKLNTMLSAYAQDKFNIEQSLLWDENNKVSFNINAFKLIDALNEVNSGENTFEQLIADEIKTQKAYSVSNTELSPELTDTLVNFLVAVNPNFRVEILEEVNDGQGVSVNGVLKLNEFLIQLKEGNENALPEETAHVLVEMLDKNSELFKAMDSTIVYTKMYAKVLKEYGNHPEYKGNYAKLRREATAKLISLYLNDKKLAEQFMGSSDLISKIKSIIQNIINKFKGLKNPFNQAALRILNLQTRDILFQNALDSEVMYSLETYENVENFQTLNKNVSDFAKILININDSILDYKNYTIPDRPRLSDPSRIKKGKDIKREMWTSPHFTQDLANYYANAKLTKLGRELRDKIKSVGESKFEIYTDAPVTAELLNRLYLEFGISSDRVVRTSGELIIGEDENGNPVIGSSDKSEALLGKAALNGKTLIVDNRRNDLFKSTDSNLDFVYYNNSRVKYTDYKELIKRRELEEKQKELTESTLAEFEKLSPGNIVQLVKPALNLIQNLVGRIEKGEKFEELSEIFKDQFGNLIIPIDRARQILRQLEENSGEFEQGLLNFMNSIGTVTMFLENANKTNYNSLRELGKGNKEDVNKAIKESASLMRIILNWENWLDSVQPIISDPQFEDTKIIKSKISDLRKALGISKERVKQIATEVISKQLADVGKYYNEGKLAALKAGMITKEQYNAQIVTPEKIANTIFGLDGDAGMTSYFENALFNEKDLIQAISTIVEKSIIGANTKSLDRSIDLNNKIGAIQDSLGLTNEQIGEKITYIDKINKFEQDPNNPEESVMVQKDALTFLNPFKNRWVKKAKLNELNTFKKDLYKAREVHGKDSEQAANAEKEYDTAYKSYKSWEKDNWYREMATEPWEIYQAFGLVGDDFDRAQEYQETLWEERRALRNELRQPTATQLQQDFLTKEIENIEKRLKNLRNTFDVVNNRVKGVSDNPEEDIRIANILKEKSQIDRQLYTYEVNTPKFLKDLQEKINEIGDTGIKNSLLAMMDTKNPTWLKDLYHVAESNAPYSFVEWLDKNSKVMYSENFYENRKKLIDTIKNSVIELSGFLSQDSKNELVDLNKNLQNKWEEIFNLSSSLRDENGVFDASDASLEHQKLIKNAEAIITRIKNLIKAESSIIQADFDNYSSDDVQRIKILKAKIGQGIDDLLNIQSKNPTDYYHDIMYEKLKDIYPLELGRVFPGENYLYLIDSPEFTTWLRNQAPREFVEWFDANHIIKTNFNPVIGEDNSYYQPTYIWMKISPTNESDILLAPSYKYGDREFKDSAVVEYKDTKKFFQLKTEKKPDTWDDNLGEWLPKSKEFRNEAYFELQRTDPQLFGYLQTVSAFYTESQSDAPRDAKLGNTLPYMNKTFTDGGGLASLWKEFNNKLNPAESGEANSTELEVDKTKKTFKQKIADKLRAFAGLETVEQESKIVSTDLLGNKIQKIYTPYSNYLDPKDVTRDTLVSVLNFSEGLQRTKALVNNIPELNLLEQLLDEFNPFEREMLNTKGQRVPTQTKRMLEIIRNIKKTKLYGDVKDYEMGVKIDQITVSMRKYTTFFSQSVINPANAFKNYIQGQLTNLISAGVSDWATSKSIMQAMKMPQTSYVHFLRQIFNKEKSLDFQIMTLFNLSLTQNITDLYSGSAAKRQFKDLDKLSFMSSEAGEFGVMSTLLYSHLLHKKIKINGETKNLYDVFHLVNGKVSLKENAYDGERLIDTDYLNDLILRAKVVGEHVQGKQWNPTIAQRFTIWRNFEFFKKYFIPKLRERFVSKRKNLVLGDDIEGFYVTTFKRFLMEIVHYLDNGRMSGIALSPSERRARALMSKELIVMLATYVLITFALGYDDDDDDRFKKLKKNSWAHNFALQILLNSKKEIDSTSIIPLLNIQENIVPPLFNETYSYVKEPFVGFGLFEQGKKLADASFSHLTGSNNAYYDKKIPQYFIDKGESKLHHQLIDKLLHWDTMLYLASPEYKVQTTQQMLNM